MNSPLFEYPTNLFVGDGETFRNDYNFFHQRIILSNAFDFQALFLWQNLIGTALLGRFLAPVLVVSKKIYHYYDQNHPYDDFLFVEHGQLIWNIAIFRKEWRVGSESNPDRIKRSAIKPLVFSLRKISKNPKKSGDNEPENECPQSFHPE